MENLKKIIDVSRSGFEVLVVGKYCVVGVKFIDNEPVINKCYLNDQLEKVEG